MANATLRLDSASVSPGSRVSTVSAARSTSLASARPDANVRTSILFILYIFPIPVFSGGLTSVSSYSLRLWRWGLTDGSVQRRRPLRVSPRLRRHSLRHVWRELLLQPLSFWLPAMSQLLQPRQGQGKICLGHYIGADLEYSLLGIIIKWTKLLTVQHFNTRPPKSTKNRVISQYKGHLKKNTINISSKLRFFF